MPRGIGRPKGRKSILNPLTHGGNRLEVRQRIEPSRTQLKADRAKARKVSRILTTGKLAATQTKRKK